MHSNCSPSFISILTLANVANTLASTDSQEVTVTAEDKIPGTYKLSSPESLESDEFNQVMRAMGFKKYIREHFKECTRLAFEIGYEGGEGQIAIVRTAQCDCFEMRPIKFENKNEVDNAEFCDGRKVKVVVEVDEDNLMLKKIISIDGLEGGCVQIFKFLESGMELSYEVKGHKVVLKFERFFGLLL